MAVLNWNGKKEALDYIQDIPYRLIEISNKENINNFNKENFIINGNELDVMKSLLPVYKGEIKCIYADLPKLKSYSNSSESNSDKHDEWMSMIYQRLIIAKELMSYDSIIFISVDDEEIPMTRIAMDNLFGRKNMLACFIWQSVNTLNLRGNIKVNHRYILAYTKDIDRIKNLPVIDPSTPKSSKVFKKYIENTIVKNGPKNPMSEVKIPVGFPANIECGTIDKHKYKDKDRWPRYSEDLKIEDYKLQNDVIAYTGWSSKDQLIEFINSGFKAVKDNKGQETKFEIRKSGAIYGIKKRSNSYSHVLSVLREEGIVQNNIEDVQQLVGDENNLNPTDLIKYLISMIDSNEFTTLEIFSRNASVAEAILQLNEEDIFRDINYILINSTGDKKIIEKVGDFERYIGTKKTHYISKLGKPIIDKSNKISKEICYNDLAYYIYFNEMKTSMKENAIEKPFILKNKEKAIVLLYNHDDELDEVEECLDMRMLRKLIRSTDDGCNITVYAKSCIVEKEDLYTNNIIFKQIPYDVKLK